MRSVVPAWIYLYPFLAHCCSTSVCSGQEPLHHWQDTGHGEARSSISAVCLSNDNVT